MPRPLGQVFSSPVFLRLISSSSPCTARAAMVLSRCSAYAWGPGTGAGTSSLLGLDPTEVPTATPSLPPCSLQGADAAPGAAATCSALSLHLIDTRASTWAADRPHDASALLLALQRKSEGRWAHSQHV